MKYLMILSFLIFSNFSSACSCITPSIEESFLKADYVYIGVIESAKLSSESEVTNYLTVEKEFKGKRNTEILFSNVSYGSCFFPTAVGYRYLVFGKTEDTPVFSACGQTQLLFGDSADLIEELEALAKESND